MSTSIVVRLDCPHCQHSFLEAASLVRPNGKAYCPVCAHLFHLDPEIEAMRTEYVSASDDATKKEIATRIQEHVMDNVNYLMMGEYIIPQARRSNIEDMIPSPVPVFWNMTKAAE